MRFNHGTYAELHLHLGGAIMPRILHAHLVRESHDLLGAFPDYESFEDHFRRPRRSLSEFLKLHELVEQIQTPATIRRFVEYLVRGAVLFEDLAYVELRHTPWLRTDRALPFAARVDQMRQIIRDIESGARSGEYPIFLHQILCMHTALPDEVNEAIVALAVECRRQVCAVDIAGPDVLYEGRIPFFARMLERAREAGLKTTAHCFETPAGCYDALLPLLDRVGHGIQIPLLHPRLLDELARRGQCLEVCPTSYLKTGQMAHYAELQPVFQRCASAGVAVTLCTDNAGMHMVRLPQEYENLLIHEVISVRQMRELQDAAFRHAFRWPFDKPAREMLLRDRSEP